MGAASPSIAAPIGLDDVAQARAFGGELQAWFILLLAMQTELPTLVVDCSFGLKNV